MLSVLREKIQWYEEGYAQGVRLSVRKRIRAGWLRAEDEDTVVTNIIRKHEKLRKERRKMAKELLLHEVKEELICERTGLIMPEVRLLAWEIYLTQHTRRGMVQKMRF